MGLKHGWGRETVERTGQVFEGRFRSGYKHGHGVMHYGNGDAYHGQVICVCKAREVLDVVPYACVSTFVIVRA